MRDSLSILDKIVSFTNGAVTYKNTLEHLNILDEDYYFRLLDFIQQQDLSNALLMYDEINRKGFEGDLVLNSFAEFIRNLLVCKDEKAAVLLEVVESFKVNGIPAKFIIDKNGNIRFALTGFAGGNDAAVEELSAMIELAKAG